MSTAKQHKPFDIALLLKIGAGVIAAIWLLKTCSKQQERRDVEIKGRGMLEAKGFYGDLPSGAGADYYHMLEDASYKSEDYSVFFAQLNAYRHGRGELRKRGLSEGELNMIPEPSVIDAALGGSAALDKLARQYE
jgi:hypothetical protein